MSAPDSSKQPRVLGGDPASKGGQWKETARPGGGVGGLDDDGDAGEPRVLTKHEKDEAALTEKTRQGLEKATREHEYLTRRYRSLSSSVRSRRADRGQAANRMMGATANWREAMAAHTVTDQGRSEIEALLEGATDDERGDITRALARGAVLRQRRRDEAAYLAQPRPASVPADAKQKRVKGLQGDADTFAWLKDTTPGDGDSRGSRTFAVYDREGKVAGTIHESVGSIDRAAGRLRIAGKEREFWSFSRPGDTGANYWQKIDSQSQALRELLG